jgi:hypothetical protein
MSAQTKSEYLLDRISERLGVPKPAEGQVAFSPEPLGLVTGLVNLLADPAAAKKSAADFSKAQDAIGQAKRASDQAKADREAADEHIKRAQAEHADRLANELAAHTVTMERRTREVEGREAAVAQREKEADLHLAELAAERADLKRRLAAIRDAAA